MPGPALPARIRALGLEHRHILLASRLPSWTFLSMFSKRIAAVAYLRTSSAANVGADKDSDKRQRATIAVFAKAAGYTIVDEFYDAAVSGSDPVGERPGFKAMLERIASNGVRIILVESPDRFARDLAVQEAAGCAGAQEGGRRPWKWALHLCAEGASDGGAGEGTARAADVVA